MIFLDIFILVIVVEAITEILVDSELFRPIREYIKSFAYPDIPNNDIKHKLFLFIDALVSCGYCLSVWVSFIISLFSIYYIDMFKNSVLSNFILLTFVLHRLSNWFHVFFMIIKNGRISAVDIKLDMTTKSIDESNKNGRSGESII